METKKAFARVKTPMVDAAAIRIDVALMLRELAGHVEPGTSLKAVWRNLATRLRLTVGQVTRLWYENWLTIPAWAYVAVREAWEKKRSLDERVAEAVDASAVRFAERRQQVADRRGAAV